MGRLLSPWLRQTGAGMIAIVVVVVTLGLVGLSAHAQTPPAMPGAASPAPQASPGAMVPLVNGSFEEGNHGWYVESGAGAVTSNAHSGSWAMRLPATGGFTEDARLCARPGCCHGQCLRVQTRRTSRVLCR